MAEQISKPNINPIVIALCSWFTLGFLGFFMMEQKKKALGAVVYTVLGFCCLYVPGWIVNLVMTIEAYKVAVKLSVGETLEDNHCELQFLSKLPLMH